jgi:hypothetical protein
MGMYSYFVLAEPSNFKVDISNIPKHLIDYFGFSNETSDTSEASETTSNHRITLKEFGECNQRIKFLGYLTIETFNRWRELFAYFQKQARENGIFETIRLHYYYEDSQMYFIQATTDGQVDIFVGEPAHSKYFVTGIVVEKLLKADKSQIKDFFSSSTTKTTKEKAEEDDDFDLEIDEDDLLVYIPSYISEVKHFTDGNVGNRSFSRIKLNELRRDPMLDFIELLKRN